MGSVVSGILGGGQSQPTQPNAQVYQPSGTANVDSQLQALLSQNAGLTTGSGNPYSTYSPQFANIFNSLYNNPGAAGYTGAATTAGGQYGTAGSQASSGAGQLNSAALGALPGAQQVMQQGLDPQNALYNQQLQQTVDQANVANAQYGLQGQQAAGDVNQATTNFNNTWQNQQLARAISGLSAGTSAISSVGGDLNTGLNVGAGGAASTLAGGVAPYTANQNVGTNQQSALQQYITSLLGPTTSSQSTIGDLSTYLGQGIGASSQQAYQALQDYQAQLNSQANLGSGLGGLLGLGGNSGNSLLSLFGSSGGGAAADASAADDAFLFAAA